MHDHEEEMSFFPFCLSMSAADDVASVMSDSLQSHGP